MKRLAIRTLACFLSVSQPFAAAFGSSRQGGWVKPSGSEDPWSYVQPALDSLKPNGRLSWEGVPLELAPARFSLEIKDFEASEADMGQGSFSSYQKAFAALKGRGRGMVTVNMADAYGKEIFDSTLAGISLALERNPETSKKKMLQALLARLKDRKAALNPETYGLVSRLLEDALKAAAGGPGASSGLQAFLSDPMRSSPIGFWTWNGELKKIFTQDRFLQGDYSFEENGEAFGVLKALLAESPQAAKTYGIYAELEQKLNNPFSKSSLLDPKSAQGQWAFLPAVRSNETELQKELAKKGVLLMDPMEEIIKRLKAGTLSFEPKADSGFYDYQQHALEAILLAGKNPEAEKVAFGPKYLKRLEEAFKTGMAKARESHVKSVEHFKTMAGSVYTPPPPTIYISPFLPLEPLPTAYERYAEGFDFLLKALRSPGLLGESEVSAYDAGGKNSESIWPRLERARRLFYGLELVAADELGMPRGRFKRFGVDAAQAVHEAKEWIVLGDNHDELERDARFAVPVSADPPDAPRRMIYCWGTAGVVLLKAEAKFLKNPDYRKPARERVEFVPETYYLAADKFVAFKVPYEKGPLTREQFRRVLDTSKSLDDALARLERGER